MMTNASSIRRVADAHLVSAKLLYRQGQYLRATYLGGYSVELHLKARIVELLDLPDLYTPQGG
jgi:HEPN domain-containing protein